MQPDYTFALQFHLASIADRAAAIRARLKPELRHDTTKPGCILLTPKQPLRLVKLVDDLAALAAALTTPQKPIAPSRLYADVVTSNLGYVRDLSANSRGPFRLCGSTVQLLADLMPPGAQPRPSPSPLPPPGENHMRLSAGDWHLVGYYM